MSSVFGKILVKSREKRGLFPTLRWTGLKGSNFPAGKDDEGDELNAIAAQRDPAGGFLLYREEAELSKQYIGRGLKVKIVFKNEILTEDVLDH